jgi:hypothetical protein
MDAILIQFWKVSFIICRSPVNGIFCHENKGPVKQNDSLLGNASDGYDEISDVLANIVLHKTASVVPSSKEKSHRFHMGGSVSRNRTRYRVKNSIKLRSKIGLQFGRFGRLGGT